MRADNHKVWRGQRFRTGPSRQDAAITEHELGVTTNVREGIYRRALTAADAFVAAAVVLLVLPVLAAGVPPVLALVAVPVTVALGKLLGLYARDELVLKKTTLDEAPRLIELAALSALVLWLTLDGWTPVELDASDVTVLWVSMFALLVAGRTLARFIARSRSDTERCLIIGEPASVMAVKQKLADGRVDALVVASLPADREFALDPVLLEETLRRHVVRHDVHRVIIAPAEGGSAETVDLIRIAKHVGVRVSVLPRVLEVVGSSVEFDHLDGLTMLGVRRFGLSRSSRIVKRVFDVVGASILLAVMVPAMLAIAVIMRLDSHSPTFFRQTRVGKDGRRFQMLKFRSMTADAEARKDALRHLSESDGLFKLENDPRVTRVGRLLRRASLDELPQLINVWRGDMSLVGPRPLVLDEDVRVQGFDRHRLHLTPGMTGHWQILGSARVPMHEMVGIDYLYVANWSLWTDVKILLRTIPHVLASRGM